MELKDMIARGRYSMYMKIVKSPPLVKLWSVSELSASAAIEEADFWYRPGYRS